MRYENEMTACISSLDLFIVRDLNLGCLGIRHVTNKLNKHNFVCNARKWLSCEATSSLLFKKMANCRERGHETGGRGDKWRCLALLLLFVIPFALRLPTQPCSYVISLVWNWQQLTLTFKLRSMGAWHEKVDSIFDLLIVPIEKVKRFNVR